LVPLVQVKYISETVVEAATVQAGTITLDGIELRDLKLKDLRSCIGQSGCIFISWHCGRILPTGGFSAAPTEVIAAAGIAEAHDLSCNSPRRNDCGERGQKLSGGQRGDKTQRSLKNRRSLMSYLGSGYETEAAIQRSLERITIDRTTIAIAHRLPPSAMPIGSM